MMKRQEQFVPEIIKNIAQRASPTNPHTNQTEKMVAREQLESIRDYCIKALETLGKFGKR